MKYKVSSVGNSGCIFKNVSPNLPVIVVPDYYRIVAVVQKVLRSINEVNLVILQC